MNYYYYFAIYSEEKIGRKQVETMAKMKCECYWHF